MIIKIAKKTQLKYSLLNALLLNMPFTEKQMFQAIEANVDVRDCFEKITDACKELQSKTACPNDDIDRFLEFAVGKWSD